MAEIGNVALYWVRDEVGLQMLADDEVGLAFLGDDKMWEFSLNGQLPQRAVVDQVPLDCRLVLAGRGGITPTESSSEIMPQTATTSYPRTLEVLAVKWGLKVVPDRTMSGGCEAFAAAGLSDFCFDVKQSGETLIDNELIVYGESDQLKLNVLSDAEFQSNEQDILRQALLAQIRTLQFRCQQAKSDPDASSFTIELFRDENKMYKKIGEEFAELMRALLTTTSSAEVIGEAADLLLNIEIALIKQGLNPIKVLEELVRRNRNA